MQAISLIMEYAQISLGKNDSGGTYTVSVSPKRLGIWGPGEKEGVTTRCHGARRCPAGGEGLTGTTQCHGAWRCPAGGEGLTGTARSAPAVPAH